MKLLQKIIVVLILSFGSLMSYSQWVPMQDTAFAHAIAERWPDVVNADTTQLDTVLAATKSVFFNVSDRGTIEKIEVLIYFKNLTGFNAKNNKITTVPDLTGLSQLVTLNLSNNNIHTMPNVSGMSSIKNLYLTYNYIDSIIGISNHPTLVDIHLGNNDITHLPDLSTIPNLQTMSVGVNRLPWIELQSLSEIPDYLNLFTIFPQKEVTKDTTITRREFESFTIAYPNELIIPDLLYKYQKNNTGSFLTSSENSYTIEHVSFENAGIYEVFAEGSVAAWEGNSTVTGETKLNVIPCQVIDSVATELFEDCPNTGAIITYLDIENKAPSFETYFVNTESNELYLATLNEKVILPNGTYNFLVTDNYLCSKTKDSVVVIEKTNECVFCDSLAHLQYEYLDTTMFENYGIQHSINTLKNVDEVSVSWVQNKKEVASGIRYLNSSVQKENASLINSYVTCPLQTGEYIFKADSIQLTINDYQTILSHEISKDYSCENFILNLTSLELSNTDNRFFVEVKNENEDLLYSYEVGDNIYLPVGLYSFVLTDNGNYSEIIESNIAVTKPKDCNSIFSPNNDGDNDVWYIAEEGELTIVDKTGTILIHLNGPCSWNGTDNNGKDVPIGVYSIITSDNEYRIVTLIR